MAMEAIIEGGPALIARLKEIGDKVNPLAAAALVQQAEAIMSESKSRFVPVDTGVLRASGVVGAPQVGSDGIEVKMGYGGAAEDYAVIQHENLSYRHSVGGPKYLERPLLEAASGMAERLAKAIRGGLG